MAKHRRKWNQRVYEKYISEGRGQGEGKNYKPWIKVQDFSSIGTISRIYSNKTGRVHHLLSNNEKYYFYIAEWSEKVTDIREQFPLSDVRMAIDIAAVTGIRYPADNISGYPYVMTCDFMLTTIDGLKARTVKQVSELSNPRVIEKLEIERRYWDRLGIDWKLVTDRDIDIRKAQAIEWVRQDNDAFGCVDLFIIEEAKRRFTEDATLAAANSLDLDFNLLSGTGLSLFKQLIRTRQIRRVNTPKIGAVDVNLLQSAR